MSDVGRTIVRVLGVPVSVDAEGARWVAALQRALDTTGKELDKARDQLRKERRARRHMKRKAARQ